MRQEITEINLLNKVKYTKQILIQYSYKASCKKKVLIGLLLQNLFNSANVLKKVGTHRDPLKPADKGSSSLGKNASEITYVRSARTACRRSAEA